MAFTAFATPTISCMSCAAKIESGLSELEGVSDVNVDVNARQVRVAFDEGLVDERDLANAITAAGYEVGPAVADEHRALLPTVAPPHGED